MKASTVRAGAAEKAARVRLFLLDVDGVLTDGGIVFDGDGREIKRFHVRDGHGIKMIQRAGVEVGIITGRTSEVVNVRAKELGIALVRQGATDKVAAWREILLEKGISAEETAYVGDDIVDVPLLRQVGFSAAVADAESEVLVAVDFVSSRAGGHGAVREIIEFVLRSSGAWEKIVAKYLGSERPST
ncbi:MAG: HAD-IIIA family hydrolase [Deltaproteobacteria bacterium]|nr:HAD-IIIA family hydrolase [Deltaproteobacteria bacterium]